MAGSILGEQVLRKEDPKFLTTGGEYLADISEPLLEGAAHVVFARSPMAHGTIESIDISEAESMPGVIGIYTADSLGLEPTKSNFNPGVARTLLASDKVRWVGEPIVAVVAETYAQATDAAQMVFVDIDPLPAVIDMKEALTSSTHIYDGAGSNAVFDSAAFGGQPTTGDAFFEGCEVVVSTEALNQRVAPCPLEPRAAAATWHEGRLYEWLSTQHAQGAVGPIAGANGIEASQVRVITPDVGGGFGAKIGCFSEELLLGLLSKESGRPIKFAETRSESMMNLGHGRAQHQVIKVGGSRDGKITHFQLEMIQDSGAFCEVHRLLPTRRLSLPTAEPAGLRPPQQPSERWTSSPPKSEWTPQRFAARTSSHRSMSRTPPQSVRPTTWATSSAVSTVPWSTPVTKVFGPSRHNAVPTVHRSCLALVSAPMSKSPVALALPKKTRRSSSTQTAPARFTPAPHPTAKVMTPHGR
jgi:hypothetical protein